MRKLSIRDMRAALPEIDKLLAREGEALLTCRGRPVARLLPIAEAKPRPSHAKLRARMKRSAVGSEVYVREDRDGR